MHHGYQAFDSTAAPRTVGIEPSAGFLVPDFDYDSTPYGWRHLHDLVGPAGTVLVVDPGDEDLAALERGQAAFEAIGAVPAAVVRDGDRSCWERLIRMRLTYSLLSDPDGVVADSLGVGPSDGASPRGSWFVVGADRRLRDAGRDGVVFAGFTDLVVTTLAGRRVAGAP